MVDTRRLSVHQLRRTDDACAVRLTNCLMAETHAENRSRLAELPDQIDGDAGVGWNSGARRNDNRGRIQLSELVDGDLIVAPDLDCLPHLAQILDEIVCERVVVIDDEYHLIHERGWN